MSSIATTNPPSDAALAKKGPMDTLKDLFEKARPSMAAVVPKHLNVDKLTKIALVAISKNPKLLACTPQSILQSVMEASQLGLDCGGILGSAYLVPFKKNWKDDNGNWQSRQEAKLITGYRGLIDLARRSGQIDTIEAHPVYPGEEFELEFGLSPRLVHKPKLDVVKSNIVGSGKTAVEISTAITFYAVARLKDGGTQVEVMSRADVDRIRARSRSADDGPWVTDYDEMGRKTAVRRICKYLPLSPELVDRIMQEDEQDFGIDVIPEAQELELPKRLSEGTPEDTATDAPAPEPPPSQNPVLQAELLAAEEKSTPKKR
jgi:recombination protein RecT